MTSIRRTGVLLLVLSTLLVGACAYNASAPTSSVPDWQTKIAQVPLPGKGCFQAHYPKLQWQSVACAPTPTYPQPPSEGPAPNVVGNGDDLSAKAPSGHISTAKGSFDSAVVASESGPIANSGPSIPNAYTLQLNTNPFPSNACNRSPNTGCLGWEQFVFENTGSSAGLYIQYWLIRYNTTARASRASADSPRRPRAALGDPQWPPPKPFSRYQRLRER